MYKDVIPVVHVHDGQREADDGEHEVAKVPEAEEHHEQVEDALDALAGERRDRQHGDFTERIERAKIDEDDVDHVAPEGLGQAAPRDLEGDGIVEIEVERLQAHKVRFVEGLVDPAAAARASARSAPRVATAS